MEATERRSIATGGVWPVETNTNGERQVGHWLQIGASAIEMNIEAKVFKSHAAPLGLCDNLINSLKLLANQQTDGDTPIQSIVTGLHERSRKGIMEGPSSFIKEDSHCAVDVGRFRKGTRPLHVQKTEV